MKWWERLGRTMEARRLTPDAVAERARVNLKSLYGYLQGDVDQPRGDIVKRLAAAVGMTELALRYGSDGFPENTVELKRIPLITMNKLGTLTAGQDPMAVWDGSTVVSVPADVPDGAYGVTLVDSSNEPDFARGDIVICDPLADLEPGRYVVAILTEEQQAHFAKWRPLAHRDVRRFVLTHANADYPDIEVGSRIKGFILARAIKHIRNI
jgi:SOS-response transcriptional repressor LexA